MRFEHHGVATPQLAILEMGSDLDPVVLDLGAHRFLGSAQIGARQQRRRRRRWRSRQREPGREYVSERGAGGATEPLEQG